MNDNNKPNGPQDHEVDLIDLEEFAKNNNGKPPKARRYRIRVDREKYTVDVPGMKGREILTLAGKTPPERYLLNQKFKHGQMVPIALDQDVDFTEPGVERFTTLPKDQTEGREGFREQFKLPETDLTELSASGYTWETIQSQGNWLLVHGVPVPAGYNEPHVSVALQIPSGYPTAALDMAYFHLWLKLTNGRAIPSADTNQPIDGKGWQRWSRHYTPQHPWLPGEYNVVTHLTLVRSWLERELERN